MASVSIDDILEVLLEQSAIIDNMSKFGRQLGVKDHQLKNWVKQINTEPDGIETALYRFMEVFVNDNGGKATVQTLTKYLEKFGCISGRDNLKDKYKNLNIRIVLRKSPVAEPESEPHEPSYAAEAISKSSAGVEKYADERDAPLEKRLQKKKYPPGKLMGLIINLKQKRTGARFDEIRLKSTLEGCNFNVRTSKRFGKQDIIKDLKNLSEEVLSMEKQNQPVGGVLVAIMGHGRKYDKLITESRKCGVGLREALSIRKAIAIFERVQAPKIFLINMCRGKAKDFGTDDDNDDENSSSAEDDSEEEVSDVDVDVDSSWEDWSSSFRNDDSNNIQEDGEYSSRKDILVIHATYPGYVAWRNLKRGTYFIQAFCRVVKTHACEEDGESIDTLLGELGEIFKSAPTVVSDSGEHKFRWQSPTVENTSFNRHFMIKYNKDNTY